MKKSEVSILNEAPEDAVYNRHTLFDVPSFEHIPSDATDSIPNTPIAAASLFLLVGRTNPESTTLSSTSATTTTSTDDITSLSTTSISTADSTTASGSVDSHSSASTSSNINAGPIGSVERTATSAAGVVTTSTSTSTNVIESHIITSDNSIGTTRTTVSVDANSISVTSDPGTAINTVDSTIFSFQSPAFIVLKETTLTEVTASSLDTSTSDPPTTVAGATTLSNESAPTPDSTLPGSSSSLLGNKVQDIGASQVPSTSTDSESPSSLSPSTTKSVPEKSSTFLLPSTAISSTTFSTTATMSSPPLASRGLSAPSLRAIIGGIIAIIILALLLLWCFLRRKRVRARSKVQPFVMQEIGSSATVIGQDEKFVDDDSSISPSLLCLLEEKLNNVVQLNHRDTTAFQEAVQARMSFDQRSLPRWIGTPSSLGTISSEPLPTYYYALGSDHMSVNSQNGDPPPPLSAFTINPRESMPMSRRSLSTGVASSRSNPPAYLSDVEDTRTR